MEAGEAMTVNCMLPLRVYRSGCECNDCYPRGSDYFCMRRSLPVTRLREKVVRPKPDRPDRLLRPCSIYRGHTTLSRSLYSQRANHPLGHFIYRGHTTLSCRAHHPFTITLTTEGTTPSHGHSIDRGHTTPSHGHSND